MSNQLFVHIYTVGTPVVHDHKWPSPVFAFSATGVIRIPCFTIAVSVDDIPSLGPSFIEIRFVNNNNRIPHHQCYQTALSNLTGLVGKSDQGSVIALGTPTELVSDYGGRRIIEARPNAEQRGRLLAALTERGVHFEEVEDTLYIFQTDEAFDEQLAASLGQFSYRTSTLEDVFLRLTGRSLNE